MSDIGGRLGSKIDGLDGENGHLPAARQTKMVEHIRAHGQMTVNELIALFGVSRDTIRRDLAFLEERSLIARTHGGAVPADRTSLAITTLDSRMSSHALSKRLIGAATARLIRDGETLILNGGSTTTYFAAALKDRRNLTVVTNNLRVLPALPEQSARSVYLLGGTYVPSTQVLVRVEGFGSMPNINVDTAVIGATGVSAEGLSTGGIEEATATRAMMQTAQRTIVIADSTKFNVVAFARVAQLHQIRYLVTDKMPDDVLRAALENADVEIVICKPD